MGRSVPVKAPVNLQIVNKINGFEYVSCGTALKLLNDSDDDVRGNATNQLKEIDPATAVKFGIK
jgi:hypothetical protein